MSVAAVKTLASAAATTLHHAIGTAETTAELDDLARRIWRGYGDRVISENDANHLVQYIEERRPLRRHLTRQPIPPILSLPEPNLRRVGHLFQQRRTQRSPNKQASCDRRHRL